MDQSVREGIQGNVRGIKRRSLGVENIFGICFLDGLLLGEIIGLLKSQVRSFVIFCSFGVNEKKAVIVYQFCFYLGCSIFFFKCCREIILIFYFVRMGRGFFRGKRFFIWRAFVFVVSYFRRFFIWVRLWVSFDFKIGFLF